MNYLNNEISVFNNCKTIKPFDNITIGEFLNEIKDEIYSKEIKKLRSIEDKKQRNAYKSSSIKTITYAGLFFERKNEQLSVPSSIIILDIDNIPESEKKHIKIELSEDAYTLAVWNSPSGSGLKLMVKMNFGFNADVYKAKYLCVLHYYSKTYNIPIGDSKNSSESWGLDLACSDVARQCIFSSDSEIHINEESDVFENFDNFSDIEQKVISIIKEINEIQIDITVNYDDWFKIGCAFNYEFGEAGRKYFHSVGCFYPNYTQKETDKKYNEIINSGRKDNPITVNTFFAIAKSFGLKISGVSKSPIVHSIDIHSPNENEFNIPYKPFPVEIFPSEIKDYIKEVQQSLMCPTDFIGVAVLAAVSAAIGSTRMIQARNGHTESANLFLAIVAEPGSKKSPAIDYANIVIEKMQAKAKAEFEIEYENYKEELINWEKENKKERGPKPIEPSMKQYFVSDFTMEVLTSIMSKNERGLLLISDELASWVNSMDAYRKKGSDKQKWLSLWSRASIKVDRKSDLPIYIKNPFVSVIGGIQPEIIRDFNNKNRKDGFIDRLLFSFPERLMEYSEFSISQLAKDNYIKALMQLYNYSPTIRHQDNFIGEETQIVPIKMDEEANEIWKHWNIQLIEEMKHGYFPYYLRGSWSKLIGHTLRFALIFHCLKNLHQEFSNKITKDDMLCAIELSDYFKYQTFKVMNYCNSSEMDVSINDVYACAKNQGGEVTARQVYKNRIGKCKNAEDVEKIFKEMEKRKMGEMAKKTPLKGGRESIYFKITEQ